MNKMILAVAASLVVSSAAFAADSKVGFVDVQKAVQATAAGKKAKASMDTEYNKRKKELEKKNQDIVKMGQDLEKKKAVMAEEAFNRKVVEFQEEQLKFQKVVADNQLEIQKKEKELVEPILEKMKKVIDKVAAEKGFSVVLQKQGDNVLFAQKDADLTDAVVQAYEKEK